MKILVIGYGNPGRSDDGLGVAMVAALEAGERPQAWSADTRFISALQLNIEHAADLAEADAVLFVDAAVAGVETCSLRRVQPAKVASFTTHSLAPETLLALCGELYDKSPRCFILAVRGYKFGFAETLSADARRNLEQAATLARELLATPAAEWRECVAARAQAS